MSDSPFVPYEIPTAAKLDGILALLAKATDLTAEAGSRAAADTAEAGLRAAADTALSALIAASASVVATGSPTSRSMADRFADQINVKNFGAKGDGVTDDTVTLSAAATYAAANGGSLFLPPGRYLTSGSGVTIDQSGMTLLSDPTRVDIRGSGSGNTIIQYSGTGVAFTYRGSTGGSGGGASAFFTMEGIQLTGPGAAGSSTGLFITLAAYFQMRDVFIWNFGNDLVMTDTLSCLFEACRLLWAVQGLQSNNNVFSPPNAITCIGCTIGLHQTYGALVGHCDTFTYLGGSIESCGLGAVGSNGYGIQLYQPGDDGAVAATFLGTHFEGNSNIADILLNTSPVANQPVALNAIGCSFARSSNTKFANNCIQVNSSAGNAPVKLNTFGCGFRSFNGYVPSVLRPYVLIQAGGGQANYTDFGSIYGDAVEAPTPGALPFPIATPRALATARATFNWTGSAIVVNTDSLNVGGITRSSAGVYVLTFATPMLAGGYSVAVHTNAAGFAWATSPTTATVTLHTNDATNTPVDPALVYVTIFGGSPF